MEPDANGIIDGIGNGRCAGYHGSFPDTFGAPRAFPVGGFNDSGLVIVTVRAIQCGRDLIISKLRPERTLQIPAGEDEVCHEGRGDASTGN